MSPSAFTTRLAALSPVLLLGAALTWSGCGEDDGGANGALAPTPLPEFPSLGMHLEVPPSVRLGERVPLKLTVENVTEAPVQFGLGGTEDTNYVGSYDFVVTTADGFEVWHWLGTGTWATILSRVTLQPGEQLRFEQEWPQVDNRGGSVQPGTYLVRGVLRLETLEYEQIESETEAEELVVSP